MNRIFFTLLTFVISVSVTAQINEKITFSNGVFEENTSWSICVADALTGEVISDKDAQINLVPASVMKLVPTSAALTLLGEEYRFTTSLAFSGNLNFKKGELKGDIIIIGGGDPMFCSPYFSDSYGDIIKSWVMAIRGAGIKRISGNIIADASIYAYQSVPGGWEWEDIGNNYGAGVHGINFNDNAFEIYITSGKEETRPAIDSIEPCGKNIVLTNNLISRGKKNKWNVFSAPYDSDAILDGIVATEGNVILSAALPDPPLTVASLLRERLIAENIPVNGGINTRRVLHSNDSVMEMISTAISPSLKEMIIVTNHESMNLYAAQLCKHLGLVFRNEGSFTAGMDVLRSFLETIGCKSSEINLADASGLSRNNAINTASMVKLLTYMYNSPNKETFIASLPEGGLSGTLKNSFRDDIFKDRIIAKTGSMSGVKSLAGYVTTSSGKVMAFSIIVNGFTTTNGEIQEKIEELMKEIILNY